MDVALVTQLLRSQCPDLADLSIRESASGFDNTIWRLGDDLVIRLPRRAVGARLMEHELRWLPELAPRLTLDIPTPLRAGQPSEEFSWPWSISKWIDGSPGNAVPSSTLSTAAKPLATFLRSLHVVAPAAAPSNEYSGVTLRRYDTSFLTHFDQMDDIDAEAVLRIWRTAVDAPPWSHEPLWIHGDLHPANIIFRGGVVVGVIDFGDLCAGDPATDLAGAFLSLSSETLDEFFDAYGDLDDATMQRTLGWAVHFGLMFILLGKGDEPSYGPIGRRAIENAVHFVGHSH